MGGCLAHDINEGYRGFLGQRLLKINGTKVRNMRSLVERMAPLLDASVQPPRSHVIVNWHGHQDAAVFETGALRDATPTILRQHKVPSWTSMLDVELNVKRTSTGSARHIKV